MRFRRKALQAPEGPNGNGEGGDKGTGSKTSLNSKTWLKSAKLQIVLSASSRKPRSVSLSLFGGMRKQDGVILRPGAPESAIKKEVHHELGVEDDDCERDEGRNHSEPEGGF